jgi:hypothetical protein
MSNRQKSFIAAEAENSTLAHAREHERLCLYFGLGPAAFIPIKELVPA